jgi:hypothetical protein
MNDNEISREIAEKWLPLSGVDPLYEVSNWGRIRSWKHKTGKRSRPYVLKTCFTNRGYGQVHLTVNGRPHPISIHRTVLGCFVGPPPSPEHHAAHRDGNTRNNFVGNLTWKTPKENVADTKIHGTCLWGERANQSKLTWESVASIRKLYTLGWFNFDDLAMLFSVHRSTVWRIATHRSWPLAALAAVEQKS